MKIQTILLIFISTLFNGCVDTNGLTPKAKSDIAELLDIQPTKSECKYPKLPIYKAPAKTKVPKGMSLEDAFKLCAKKNAELRRVNYLYRKGHIKVNKAYHGS